MNYFDASKDWTILAKAAAKNAAEELACYISLLREQAGIGGGQPPVEDADAASAPDAACIIVLNSLGENLDRNGFTWRSGSERIELYGDSLRGLWNSVFDFLAAMGFAWPRPGVEEPPAVPDAARYPLKNGRAYTASAASPGERRRLIVAEKTGAKERQALIRWAARNKIDALVFPLGETSFWKKPRQEFLLLDRYALIPEAGCGDLSLLLPRSLFLFHRDMFRMETGKRTARYHFCPTNPKTTSRVMEQAGKLFSRAAFAMTANATKVFYLRPQAGLENTWCSCPACRAFSPAEQYRIAVNTAADALAAIEPKALLAFWESPLDDHAEGKSGIALRRNMFAQEFTLNYKQIIKWEEKGE